MTLRTRTPGSSPGRRPGEGPSRLRVVDPHEADETERAKELCLDELDRGPRTRSELATLLARKEFSADTVEGVLDRLVELGLVDDAAFAEQWVTDRHRRKGLAGNQLRQELQRKGVDREVVDAAVGTLAPEAERDAALAVIQRKLAATRGLDPQVRARRLVSLLARKGYGAGLAYDVVREALAEDGTALR
jgi:regulatory protein